MKSTNTNTNTNTNNNTNPYSLIEKIKCYGIKPTKYQVYQLAAELVSMTEIAGVQLLSTFKDAIIAAMQSYDYYTHNNNDYYYYYNYNYYYDYDYNDYDYNYDYTNYSTQEKIICLLLLSEITK